MGGWGWGGGGGGAKLIKLISENLLRVSTVLSKILASLALKFVQRTEKKEAILIRPAGFRLH